MAAMWAYVPFWLIGWVSEIRSDSDASAGVETAVTAALLLDVELPTALESSYLSSLRLADDDGFGSDSQEARPAISSFDAGYGVSTDDYPAVFRGSFDTSEAGEFDGLRDASLAMDHAVSYTELAYVLSVRTDADTGAGLDAEALASLIYSLQPGEGSEHSSTSALISAAYGAVASEFAFSTAGRFAEDFGFAEDGVALAINLALQEGGVGLESPELLEAYRAAFETALADYQATTTVGVLVLDVGVGTDVGRGLVLITAQDGGAGGETARLVVVMSGQDTGFGADDFTVWFDSANVGVSTSSGRSLTLSGGHMTLRRQGAVLSGSADMRVVPTAAAMTATATPMTTKSSRASSSDEPMSPTDSALTPSSR